jgi:hypothetical protein
MNTAATKEATSSVQDLTVIFEGKVSNATRLIPFLLATFPEALLHVYRLRKNEPDLVRIRSFPTNIKANATPAEREEFIRDRSEKNRQIKKACEDYLRDCASGVPGVAC